MLLNKCLKEQRSEEHRWRGFKLLVLTWGVRTHHWALAALRGSILQDCYQGDILSPFIV
jgi:hypothetical protein